MNPLISTLSLSLFWDTDPDKIDSDKHAPFIVERVLTMGSIAEFKSILEYYGKTRLKNIIIKLRDLDIRTIQYLF